LDVPNRSLTLEVPEAELAARLAAWEPVSERPVGGYAQLFHDHVEGANTGADFDFLKGCRGSAVGKDSQ